MKKFFYTGAALTALIAWPAMAADLPARPAPVYRALPPVVWSWTSCYIGGNAGYTWGNNDVQLRGTDTGNGGLGAELADGTVPATLGLRDKGFIGGGQIGCNWQSELFVWGIEHDIQGPGATSDFFTISTNPPRAPISTSSSNKLDWLGTLRGRVGITPWQRGLLYVTGGVAYGKVELSIGSVCPTCTSPRNAFDTSKRMNAGWVVGAGLEIAFADRWTVKGEYLLYDLGDNSSTIHYPYVLINNSSLTATTRERASIARLGINYLFAGPVAY